MFLLFNEGQYFGHFLMDPSNFSPRMHNTSHSELAYNDCENLCGVSTTKIEKIAEF
jgi:hypothetical protein